MSRILVDGQNRIVEYLRVSVTDRCDMKCAYCMPAKGADIAPSCEIMQFRDFLTIIEIFAELGIRKVRLTGGEPLVRKNIVEFIRQVNHIPGIQQIALTTNGSTLVKKAAALRDAGVKRINISLDSLKRDRFHTITGRDGLQQVLDGIHAAGEVGFESVKVNMVVIGGVNDDEIEEFAEMSRTMNAQIRFIEFMPATPSVWREEKFVPVTVIKNRVSQLGELIPSVRPKWGGPAEVYRFAGAMGEVGFIAAVSRHFCGDCNRLRLTSTGKLLTCLFGKEDLDLKALLVQGASREDIAGAIMTALAGKNAVRVMPTDGVDDARPTMSCVGG